MTPDLDDLYHELSCYTLTHPDPSFIHQHIVDAYTAQNANEITKPIAVVFALIGLYLHVEKNFTGRQVQRFHMKLAKIRRPWIRPHLLVLDPSGRRGAYLISCGLRRYHVRAGRQRGSDAKILLGPSAHCVHDGDQLFP
jgi:Family of unknown function (DUF5946)